MLETEEGFPLEIHQESERTPCPQEHVRESPTQISTSGPKNQTEHMSWERRQECQAVKSSPSPHAGSYGAAAQAGKRWNGQPWKMCVCCEPVQGPRPWEEKLRPSPL